MRLTTLRALWLLASLLLLSVTAACTQLGNIKTNVAGQIYMKGVPVGGHLAMVDYTTKEITRLNAQTTDGHFIISDVPAGEYVIRYRNMRGHPMGGGMYIKVAPGRPVTNLKFEVWEIVPPPPAKDGTSMTKEEFKEAFDLKEESDNL